MDDNVNNEIGIDQQFNNDQQFDDTDQQFNNTDQQFNNTDQQFNNTDQQFNNTDQQFNNTDGDFNYDEGGEDYNEQDNQDYDNLDENNQDENYQDQNNDQLNYDGYDGYFVPANKSRNNFRNDRYNNAYGNYSGGYGPPGGYNNRNFGGRGNFYPPMNYGPPPMFIQPGNFSWGQGFGPGGPRRKNSKEDKTVRYLLRCGVGKDNVKNLPRDLISLIEPEYCGICAQGLDSFAMSRIHYISKNHLKNQKKWLAQQSEFGFRRAKEIPFKARELYCELCDVHITSKVHSDSHYLGKAHRAIVDGRKKPKNPFLLQTGMQERVDQLIRREKKHLKSSEEVVNEYPKDMKSVQSELFCDICKTSVTCTDQMTMHLNGKRHLAKEKQHILKMMKGGGDENSAPTAEPDVDDGDDDDNEEQEVQDSMEAENENKAGEDVEDNYDWENGGEKWEEAPKDE